MRRSSSSGQLRVDTLTISSLVDKTEDRRREMCHTIVTGVIELDHGGDALKDADTERAEIAERGPFTGECAH